MCSKVIYKYINNYFYYYWLLYYILDLIGIYARLNFIFNAFQILSINFIKLNSFSYNNSKKRD